MLEMKTLIKELKRRKFENGFLIEVDTFFDNITSGACMFSVNDTSDMNYLRKMITYIKQKDKAAEIFVSTYGFCEPEEFEQIYADTILMYTTLNEVEILQLLSVRSEIEPSVISTLAIEELEEKIDAVITTEGDILEYSTFLEKRHWNEVKWLYWD